MWYLVANLFLAHLLGDFYLQSKDFCKEKREKGWMSWTIYVHSAIIALLSWLMVWDIDAWWLALLIGVSHLLTDCTKSVVETALIRRGKDRYILVSFIADQIVHLTFMLIFASLWLNYNQWSEFSWVISGLKGVLLFFAFLIACNPTNIFFNLVMQFCKVQIGSDDSKNNVAFRAGALIGNLERILTIIFVVLGQYEVIGFLVVAKSILRFSEIKDGSDKAEYVLVGTLLSLTVAILLGLAVKYLLSIG